MNTENLIQRIEAYRKGNRITKAEMSRILGAESPNQYHNWVARGSVPKEYIDACLRVLGQKGQYTKEQIDFLEKFETLSPRDRLIVERLIDSYLKDE